MRDERCIRWSQKMPVAQNAALFSVLFYRYDGSGAAFALPHL